VAATALSRDLIQMIAEEMACGVEAAVERWMAQIDLALTDVHLTTLGRLNAVREIVESYKHLTGKVHLDRRGPELTSW
jgi:CheY-like chemotaxis protein